MIYCFKIWLQEPPAYFLVSEGGREGGVRERASCMGNIDPLMKFYATLFQPYWAYMQAPFFIS